MRGFPALTWASQQPLWRIHRAEHASVHFATRFLGGRFNPPDGGLGFGTWYLATHPRGAFAEVFGRAQVVERRQIDARVLAQAFLPSDARAG